jgi:hypothetical protein
MKLRFIAIVAVIATLGVSAIAIPQAHAQETTVPSTATILGVCGLATVPPAINYGTLAPNQVSAERNLQISNTGNAQASVSVRGTNWVLVENVATNAMPVGATHYSTSSGSYDSKTALTTENAQFLTLTALQTQNTFWQLRAALSDPAIVGATTQTVTLTGTC